MTSSLASSPTTLHTATTSPAPIVYTKTTHHRVTLPIQKRHRRLTITNSKQPNASTSQIDLVRNKDGVYAAKQATKVVVLWDLDNKPPRGCPYKAARALRRVAERFGRVMEFSAYANRHAFIHVPQWVVEERRERRQLDILERKGAVAVRENGYVCGVCGRKCKSNVDLKKHFRQLHERERQKKLSRMRALKGKKRQRFKERFVSGNDKYMEEARRLLTPKVGYGLESELRRAGVHVRTVEDKPQAADWAVKRQMEHSMRSGADWLLLVSDDSDFSEMMRKAREGSLGTVVVGDRDGALGRIADVWVPWMGVENGEVSDSDLVPRQGRGMGMGMGRAYDDHTRNGDDDDFVQLCDEHATITRISAFSDGDEEEEYYYYDEEDDDDEGLYMISWDS